MDQPLLTGPQATPRRFALPTWRRARTPADPPPEALAQILRDADCHRVAAKRLDDFERAEQQHLEDRKAKARLLLGTAGLVLGLSPAVPGVYSACHGDGSGADCTLRVTALVGGALALSGSLWAGWDLWHHQSQMARHAQRLSEALNRAQQARSGGTVVDDLYHRVLSMDHAERRSFTQHLHQLARAPKAGVGGAMGLDDDDLEDV